MEENKIEYYNTPLNYGILFTLKGGSTFEDMCKMYDRFKNTSEVMIDGMVITYSGDDHEPFDFSFVPSENIQYEIAE